MLLMSETQAQKYLDWLRGSSFAMVGILVGMLVFSKVFPYIHDLAIQLFF
jgi:FtsZ-interacting cell division protein YlmF